MSSIQVESAEAMRALGQQIGARLAAGDVLILAGPLGAGKTTLSQGIGEGLGVRGPITSPTFVISRRHPSLIDGPALVHVDAYRITSLAEVDDLDLDSDLINAVLVAEWGVGKLESLTAEYLLITIEPGEGDLRTVSFSSTGNRWSDFGAELV